LKSVFYCFFYYFKGMDYLLAAPGTPCTALATSRRPPTKQNTVAEAEAAYKTNNTLAEAIRPPTKQAILLQRLRPPTKQIILCRG
jgi:hypothetical protein